jgi:hypothetical protein
MIREGRKVPQTHNARSSNVWLCTQREGSWSAKNWSCFGHIPSDVFRGKPRGWRIAPQTRRSIQKWGSVMRLILDKQPQYEFAFIYGKVRGVCYGNIQDNLLVPEKRIIISKHAKSLYDQASRWLCSRRCVLRAWRCHWFTQQYLWGIDLEARIFDSNRFGVQAS